MLQPSIFYYNFLIRNKRGIGGKARVTAPDECPMDYKDMKDIINNIGPTADILKIVKPIYNFKAGEE
jgi:hypothetical protein